MKKAFALVLALSLLAPLCAHGEAVLYDYYDGGGFGSVSAIWAHDGTLYAFFWNAGNYCYGTWMPGDEGMEMGTCEGALADPHAVEMFVSGDDDMWVLMNDHGGRTLTRIEFEDGVARLGEEGCVALQWPDLGEAYFYWDAAPFVHAGTFACIARPGDGSDNLILTFDIETGKCKIRDEDSDGYTFSAVTMCPYRDDLFLVAMESKADKYRPGVDICTFDPRFGDIEPLYFQSTIDPNDFCGLIYDADTDTLYYVMYLYGASASLYRAPGMEPDAVEELVDVSAFYDDHPDDVCLGDGLVALADMYAVRSYDIYAENEVGSGGNLLVAAMSNELVRDAERTFVRANPDVTAKVSNAFIGQGDIGKALLTQSAQYDIYVISAGGSDYAALYDRGYLTDLSGSEKLSEFAAGVYPAMREIIEKDGALVAVPVEYNVNVPAYNPEAFQALGLTEDDVPTDWLEFLRLLQRVPERIEGTDYTAFDPFISEDGVASMILYEMMDAYELYLEYDPSAGMRFDTEIMRALLEEYGKIDFTGMGAALEERDESIVSDEKYMLFQMEVRATSNAFYAWNRTRVDCVRFMPLALVDGMEPLIEGSMDVAFLNPYSENRDAAIRYLEATVDAMPDEMRADLLPGWSESVKSDKADEQLARYDGEVAALEAEIEKATGADKEKYQEMLDTKNTERQRFLDSWYWMVSADNLERYRSYADGIRIWKNFGLDGSGQNAINTLVRQYLDGAIDADTLLKNIDQKVRMMLMED